MSFFHSLALLSLMTGLPVMQGQIDDALLEAEGRTNGKSTLEQVEKERELLQKISAVIQDGRDPVANGTLMTEDGMILTKGSILKTLKKPSVRVDRELYEEVEILGYDEESDLALIKIKASGLSTPVWGEAPTPGTIVVTNGATTRTRRRAKMGITSAITRPIPEEKVPALLGASFLPGNGLLIDEVYPFFSADNAGIKAGDRILSLGKTPVSTQDEVTLILAKHSVGEILAATVQREGKKQDVTLRFVAPPTSRNDEMSGRFHSRRNNFPECIQHDIPLSIFNAGSPLLNRKGEVVGINIARANRAESFALSTKSIQIAFEKLKKQTQQSKK